MNKVIDALPAAHSAKRFAPSSRSILCVDADDESRHLIAELLYEHEVDFALTADDAIQLAHSRSYELYFVDPAVPGFCASTLFHELRRYNPSAPIIICASHRYTAPDGAMDAFLDKPLCLSAIRQTAQRLLRDGHCGAACA